MPGPKPNFDRWLKGGRGFRDDPKGIDQKESLEARSARAPREHIISNGHWPSATSTITTNRWFITPVLGHRHGVTELRWGRIGINTAGAAGEVVRTALYWTDLDSAEELGLLRRIPKTDLIFDAENGAVAGQVEVEMSDGVEIPPNLMLWTAIATDSATVSLSNISPGSVFQLLSPRRVDVSALGGPPATIHLKDWPTLENGKTAQVTYLSEEYRRIDAWQ